jgi:phosphoribosylanthranilate isomerase
MFVKICGTTNLADALMSVAMGADAIGFVMAPSPRRIEADEVGRILREVPDDVLTVGVFRDESAQYIVDVVTETGLRGVQLHGRESHGEAGWIRARVPFVVQAFGAGDPRLDRVDDYDVDAVLLDSSTPGSGRTFDWSLVGDLPRRRRVLLAGGLRPDNVAAAVAAVRPWGVDVASGVESSPGRKDVRSVRRFIAEANRAADLPTATAPFDDAADETGDPRDEGEPTHDTDTLQLFDERR